MSPHAKLISLEFKYHDAISSVRCNLSDSHSSPIFENQSNGTEEDEHEYAKKITLDGAGLNQVRYICGSASHDCI